jgi:hypothetical protein
MRQFQLFCQRLWNPKLFIFTIEVLSCCILYNYCDYYYLTLLVIYERLKILAMFCYNLHPAQPEEDWPPLIAW